MFNGRANVYTPYTAITYLQISFAPKIRAGVASLRDYRVSLILTLTLDALGCLLSPTGIRQAGAIPSRYAGIAPIAPIQSNPHTIPSNRATLLGYVNFTHPLNQPSTLIGAITVAVDGDWFELSPAYGRDYKTAKEVRAAFKTGKDFNGDFQCGFRLVNQAAFKKGQTVLLRYRGLEKVSVFRV